MTQYIFGLQHINIFRRKYIFYYYVVEFTNYERSHLLLDHRQVRKLGWVDQQRNPTPVS